MQELVFSRRVFEELGGCPDFPLAWWSDVAWLISCSTQRGIWTMTRGRVLFRKSHMNISSIRQKEVYRLKLLAMIKFMEWLLLHIHSNDWDGFPDKDILVRFAKQHFFQRIVERGCWLGWKDCKITARFLEDVFGLSKREGWSRLLYFNMLYLASKTKGLVASMLR
jgi:hypothetical protein